VGFVTDFADQAVVLPLFVAVAVTLLLMGWKRGALAWVLAVAGTLGAVLVLKIVMDACYWMLPPELPSNPSGHTAAAAVAYGGLLAILGRRSGYRIPLLLLGVLAVAVVVGTTRVALGVHSVADVIAATLVGGLGGLALLWLAGPPPANLRLSVLAGVALVVALLFHGTRMNAEEAIWRFAGLYPWPLGVCRPTAELAPVSPAHIDAGLGWIVTAGRYAMENSAVH
jgi:membrane-associated phospholipid phosphatase